MDKMIWQNKEYELAKYTMNLARKIEAAEKSETMLDAYVAQLDLVKLALGAEAAKEILETLDLEEIDLVTLVIVYSRVVEAYEKRITDMRDEQDSKVFDSAGFRAIGKIADDVRVINSAETKKR